MKRAIILAVAAIFATGAVYAQDIDSAIEMFNNGLAANDAGNLSSALECFQSALTMAEMCGENGAETVANCKNVIPTVILTMGKKENNEKNYDEAIAKVQEAIKVAEEYGNADVQAEAEALLPKLRVSKAALLFQAKSYEEAIPAYLDVLGDNPEDGASWLRLGGCYESTGQMDEAVDALKKACQYGEETNASKRLSTLYLKLAQAAVKENKFAETIAYCVEANSYVETANAYFLAGQASQKLSKDADAIGYFEKYLALSPNAKNAGDINYTIAVLYQKAGNKAKALEAYKKLENDPKYGETAQAQIKALQQ